MDQIVVLLQSQEVNSVTGALEVLEGKTLILAGIKPYLTESQDWSDELTDQQIPQLIPVLFPELHRVFCNERSYSPDVRAKAVSIFAACTETLFSISEMDESLTLGLLLPMLPTWLGAFVQEFSEDLGHSMNSTNANLHSEILQVFLQVRLR